MIISYETFRLHADRFRKEGSCDLLICDEVKARTLAALHSSRLLRLATHASCLMFLSPATAYQAHRLKNDAKWKPLGIGTGEEPTENK